MNNMAFNPVGGLTDSSAYPTAPATEAAARAQIQGPSNQLRDYINTNFVGAYNQILTSANGYQKLPSGLIIQWGSYYTTNLPINGVGGGTIAFPIAFPNACLGIVITPDLHARGANYNLDMRLTSDVTASKSDFSFVSINGDNSAWGGLFYIAIGY